MGVKKALQAAVSETKKIGRPSKYTQETAETICKLLMCGWSLKRITSLDEMPHEDTVYGWLAKGKEHPFSEQYARAREIQAERMADELIDIADDESGDKSGELEMPNGVAVQRSRLRVDTRKWVAAKLLPKKYGEKLTHAGDEENPIAIKRVISDL